MTEIICPECAANKEKILRVSIELFSEKGYEGVTLREIAARVGIKAASIYNHFRNKEDILEQIASFFSERMQSGIYPSFQIDAGVCVAAFIRNIDSANRSFFSEPLYAKIGMILFREQFHNAYIRKMLLEELIVRPRRVLADGFLKLMETGKMRAFDPVMAAMEFHAFYVYEFYESSLAQGEGGRGEEEIEAERREHQRLFLETFCMMQPDGSAR
jgi:AcrR family transcriptional regulator